MDAGAFEDPTHADMARDDGVGNAPQLAVKKMDVRPANLAGDGLQEDRTRLQLRVGQLP